MKLIKIFLLCVLSISAQAMPDEQILKLITPAKLKPLAWYQEDQFQRYQTVLGKAARQDKNHFYYQVQGIKYPISFELTADKSKLSKLYFRILEQEIHFDVLRDFMQGNQFTETTSTERKDLKVFVSQKRKLKFYFRLADENLYSVEKWY